MKLSTAHKIGRFFQYFVLILVGVIMIYPLVWMVGATFKSNAEIFAGIGFLTANPTLQGYIDAVTQNYGGDISIWRAFINTYSFVIPKVIFTVISSVIAAYGFSRFKFKGRDMLFGIMISTLFLPQVVLNVPQYLMYNSFGWINSPFYLPCGCPPVCDGDLLRLPAGPVHAQHPPRSGRGCRHRRLRPGQDPVQDHCPDAEPLSGGLRSVPVHVELQRLHGSPALRPDPQQVPDVHLRQAVHGR